MEPRTELVLGLLKKVMSGEVSPELALEQWPSIDTEEDDLLAATWHDLSHFAADQDIRARDLAYADCQTQLLKRRVREIRQKFGP